jgi:xylulokinase
MTLVAGIDSSTQSCKIVIRDADTGALVRSGSAPHPSGTEVDPAAWWTALQTAVEAAGGLADVAALSVAGQQHGLVCLDADGAVIRPALLWNDTRSAEAADDLVRELGDGDPEAGASRWAEAVGTVPVASLTVTKLRWLADHEPQHAERLAAVALPHDWLTWRLSGAASLDTLVTDRSDASGTGYFDAVTGDYRRDLLALALRRDVSEVAGIVLPRVLGPNEPAGRGGPDLGLQHLVLGPGCGDNAGAALGLGLEPGQTSLSLGTSGVVASVSSTPTHDPTGLVSGFADATGHFLPLACTLNASRVLDATAGLLGVDHDGLSELALAASPGAEGVVLVPYLEGERTPNLPKATGSLHHLTLASMTRANLARAAVEGLLGLMAGCVSALVAQGVDVRRVTLVGGAARSEAVRQVAPSLLGVTVDVPEPGQYVADGAARQAAWVLSRDERPPRWALGEVTVQEGAPTPEVLARYAAAADDVARSQGAQTPRSPRHRTVASGA